MRLTNRLCNPTPFTVEWNYHKGQVLVIPAYHHFDLETSEQIDDFRPDSPGSEAVSMLMRDFGIFLRDPSIPYEVQALKAINDCIKSKSAMVKDCESNLRAQMAKTGNFDKSSIDELMDKFGYAAIKVQIEALTKKAEFYSAQTKASGRVMHHQYDPERTLLFTTPPREFETKIAMMSYLEDHPEDKVRYDKWLAANTAATEKSE